MINLKTVAFATITALIISACSQGESANDPVKIRQNAMQDWRHAGDIMKGMIENPESFDAAAFQEQAQFIAENAKQTWSHFADETHKGKAQDSVWSDAQGFAQKTQAFDAAADKLASVAKTATSASDVQSALDELSQNCGSCHKAYKRN